MSHVNTEFKNVEFERLRLLRKTARVARMHVMPTRRTQTVGEHTFGVLAVLDYIEPDAPKRVWRAALHHDAVEPLTGDVPATAKWRYPEVEEGLRLAEDKISVEFDLEGCGTEHWTKILKYCDIMELAIFSVEESDCGDKSMVEVAKRCLEAIHKRGLSDITPNAYRLFDTVRAYLETHYSETRTYHDW